MTQKSLLTPLPSFETNLADVMQTRQGRATIWELLKRSGFTQNAFLISGGDNSAMLFNLGQQNFGAMLYDAIDRTCPAHWVLMRNEAKQDEDHEQRYAEQQRRLEQQRRASNPDDDFSLD